MRSFILFVKAQNETQGRCMPGVFLSKHWSQLMKYSFLVMFSFFTILSAQGVHDWQTITNMNDVTDLVVENEAVWVATTGGLYRYDRQSNEIEQFNNLDGLYSLTKRAVAVDSHGNVLTGGADGLIEVYDKSEDAWSQLFALQGNPIEDILFKNDTLWVTADKGLAVFFWNGSGYTFKDYFVNFPILINSVRYVQRFAGRIWVGTDQGLLSAPSDLNKYTINDPANWILYDTSNGMSHNIIYDLQVIGEKLWVGTKSGLMTFDSGLRLRRESAWGNYSSQFIAPAAENGKYYVVNWYRYYEYTSQNGRGTETNFSQNITILRTDEQGDVWLGLEQGGLYHYGWEKPLLLNTPNQVQVKYALIDNKKRLWVSSGKPNSYTGEGFHVLQDGIWNNVDFVDPPWYKWYSLGNIVTIYEDHFRNVWLGSWGGGAMVFKANGDTAFFHNYQNAGQMIIDTYQGQTIRQMDNQNTYSDYFIGIPKDESFEIISVIKEDDANRLWFANYWAANDHLLAVAPYNGTFINLDKEQWAYFGKADGIDATQGGIVTIDFDDFGRVWIGTYLDGVYILDYNNTLYDKSDDSIYHLVVNDNLYSNQINSIAVDQDGIVWIGTPSGLNSYDGVNVYKHVGDKNGLAGPLENQINGIFVDKYNNRWFATSGGLSVLRAGKSPWDANAWIGYTSANSGLVNNNVHSVFVDSRTGQAVLATDNGISVFRGSFAQIKDDYNNTIGGPNPYVINGGQDYYILKFLKQSSSVKIFSMNGRLVRELTAENGFVDGSRARWDGRDEQGNLVPTGIYLYTAYDEEGQSVAGKIAVVRK